MSGKIQQSLTAGGTPPAAFWSLCRRGQRDSPRRAKPCKVRRAESSRPTGVMVHGGRAGLGPAPTGCQIKYSRTGQREGQAPPLRGKRGNISWQRTGGRVRRTAPTAFQVKYSRTSQREGQAPPLRGKRGNIPRQRTGGRVRRPAPTGYQAKHSKTGQREGQSGAELCRPGRVPKEKGQKTWENWRSSAEKI